MKVELQGTLVNRAISVAGPSGEAPAAAFLFSGATREILRKARRLIVILRGDLIQDDTGRAIDAEFVRASLPTGDRPLGSETGIQGGQFYSWIELREKGPLPTIDRLTADDLTWMNIPRMTPAIAREIIAFRDSRPGGLASVDELIAVNGVGDRMMDEIRARVSVRRT